MQEHDQRLGQIAYEGYSMQTGGKSLISGDDLPPWDFLDQSLKDAWIAAAQNVVANQK
jgi:hypothetical protein